MLNQLIQFVRRLLYPFTFGTFSEQVEHEDNFKPSIIFILLHSLLMGVYRSFEKMPEHYFDWNVFIGGSLKYGFFMLQAWLTFIVLLILVPAAFSVKNESYAVVSITGFLAAYAIAFNLLVILLMKISEIATAIGMVGLVFPYVILFRFFTEETRNVNFGMNVTMIISLISLLAFGFLNSNPFFV